MTVTAEQIAIAQRHGLVNVEHLAAACDKLEFPFYLACTILQKETGGLNIYGHDVGGVFTAPGRHPVTEENFAEFRRRIDAGERSNGVGPMQITWKGFFPDAEKQGLKLWLPADNIMYGVSILAEYWRASKGDVFTVGKRYNGADSYGRATVELAKVWKVRVGTDDMLPPPAPEPPSTDDPILAMIRALPVKQTEKLETIYRGKRYTLDPTDYVTYQGEHFLPLDLEIVLRCAAAVGWGPVTFIKGGLEAGGLSASTHAWFGAADIRTRHQRTEKVWDLCAAGIRSGLVMFPRGYGKDSFDPHIHVASREAGELAHRSLRNQIAEFQDGGDGLVGSKDYQGPSVRLGTWKQSPYRPENITPDTGVYVVSTDGAPLLGRDVDRRIITRAPNGSTITAVKRVQRWERENVVTEDGLFWAAEFLEPQRT